MIILFVRVSPNGSSEDDCQPSSSIERQAKLLDTVRPRRIPTKIVREAHVSAYNGDSITALAEVMKQMTSTTLLLSTSIDRVVRRKSQLEEMEKLMGAPATHHHLAMALYWDTETRVDPVDSLMLDGDIHGGLKAITDWRIISSQQRRCKSYVLGLPVVEPLIWCLPGKPSLLEEHIMRHATNAEAFAAAFRWTTFQGHSKIIVPEQLQAMDSTTRRFTPQLADQWQGFLSTELSIDPQHITIQWANFDTSIKCTCTNRGTDNHLLSCRCDCKYCAESRACDCAKGACRCPTICDCRCSHCHQGGREQICETIGCGRSTRGGRWRICWICYAPDWREQRRGRTCDVPHCDRPVTNRKIKWCSRACYGANVPNARVCEMAGCGVFCPPGTGLRCDNHTAYILGKRQRED